MAGFAQAILIDLDDTLTDDTSSVDACWTAACTLAESRLPGVDVRFLRAAIGRENSWFWSDPERARAGRLDLRANTRALLKQVFGRLGIKDTALALEIAETYRDRREESLTLFPGVIEALDRLRNEGVRLGLMTNGAAPPQRAKIERFGLARHFEHITIEGEAGFGKPDHRVYDSLLSALDTAPEDAWAVGDSLEHDVIGPMQLGLHGIWVDVRNAGLDGRPQRPDRIVSAFAEIVEPQA